MGVFKQLLVIGCVFSACAKPPPHAKQAQDVTKAFVVQIEREKGLTSLGSGGFYTNQKIDSLYVDFEVKKSLPPEEAKALLMTTVNSLVAFVNQNEGIRPFLKTYPITAEQVSISIGFINEKRAPLPGLSQIHLYDGTIYYSTFQSDLKKYTPYYQEPGCPGKVL